MKITLNWLLLVGVLTVNALANILPINGMNTGEISGLYPNYFVPAGFTFGIWSIIYLLLLAYNVAYTYYSFRQEEHPEIIRYIHQVNPLFLLTCVLNAGWILAWHYLQVALSVFIMLAFLTSLILIFWRGLPFFGKFSLGERLWLHAPFVVYFGWISVATIANITAWLVEMEWSGAGISPIHWSVLMIIIAVVLGIFITVRYRVFCYALVLAWALWGIFHAQQEHDVLLQWIPLGGIGLLLLSNTGNLWSLFRRKQ